MLETKAAEKEAGDEEEEEEEEGEGEGEGEGEEAAEEAPAEEEEEAEEVDVFPPAQERFAHSPVEDKYFKHGENLRNKFNEVELDSFMKLLNVKPHK